MFDLTKNREAFLRLPKPKAVIFDWDNTLVDTWPLIHQAIDTTMRAMNREPWGFEKVRDTVHKSMRESFPEIFGDEWQKAGEIYKKTYRSIHLNIQLLPNALKLMNALSNAGVIQIIVSNKIGATLRKEAAALDVDKKFFSIIGAQDANADKPSREPFDLALMGSGLNPEKDEIWFVGDTIADIKCAHLTGCTPVLYGHSGGEISATISEEVLERGLENSGVLPVYFDHDEMMGLVTNFFK